MERLLVLRLESIGCTAEAWFNGVPVARVGGGGAGRPGGPPSLTMVPVHEYTLQGANELELVVQPAAPGNAAPRQPVLCDGQSAASLRLLLPRMAGVAHPGSARTVAQLDWAPAADSVVEMPASVRGKADLPIALPRWRWLEAPVIDDLPALKPVVVKYLLDIALGLARGNAEPLVQASRLRLEELALAYGRQLSDDVAQLRLQVQQMHAAQPLKPALPSADTLLLRRVAGGRLIECLGLDGLPFLRSTTAGGGSVAWPVRLALVEGQLYVLR